MQTMDMGSAEAALTQMSPLPAASSYFLQLDASGRVDILESSNFQSSLVLSKPDMSDETVYEIQLDSYMMDERNVEIVNLQNMPTTVTFQPEYIDDHTHSHFSTATFEPQIQYHFEDVNFNQLLQQQQQQQQQSHSIVETVEEPVPEFTVETEVFATEHLEIASPSNSLILDHMKLPEPMQIEAAQNNQQIVVNEEVVVSQSNLNAFDGLPEERYDNTHQVPSSHAPEDGKKEISNSTSAAESIADKTETDVNDMSANSSQNLPTEPEASVKSEEEEVEADSEFMEEAIMPPIIEIYPSQPKTVVPPIVTICEEDDDDNGWCLNSGEVATKPKFLRDNMDPDDELYISYFNRPNSDKTALCVLCYDWFETMPDLENHLKTDHQNNMKLYGCKKCGKRFWSRFLRQRHEKMHRYDLKGPIQRYLPKNRPFDHYVSNHFYKRLRPAPITEDYRQHIRQIHSKIKSTEYDCIQCGQDFSTEEEYREHYDEEHALQTCLHCRKILENGKVLRKHEQEVHGLFTVNKNLPGGAWKLWESWDCEEMTERDDRLVNLSLFHNYYRRKPNGKDLNSDNRDRLLSLECEEITVSDYEVSKTLEKKKSSEKASVKSGGKSKDSSTGTSPDTSKARKNDLKAASSKLHDYDKIVFVGATNNNDDPVEDTIQEDLPFKCDTCKASFDGDADLQRHIKSHGLRSMAYMCQYCGRGFATHSNRKEHERIHTGDKPYVCPICSRAFVQISNLKKHIQTHKDKNNLQCSTCAKQFVKESSLILHQRAHSQDRKFRCHICDRAYNYASLLKRHMRIHTGENPYSCEDCGQQFHELVSLHYHRKKVHTGERPHRCDTCGRAFILSSDLKKHLKIHLRDGNSIKSSSSPGGKSNNGSTSSKSKGKGSAKNDGGATKSPSVKGNKEPAVNNASDHTNDANVAPNDEAQPVHEMSQQGISEGELAVISEAELLNAIESVGNQLTGPQADTTSGTNETTTTGVDDESVS